MSTEESGAFEGAEESPIGNDNIAESLAAHLTDSVGLADDQIAYGYDGGQPVPDDLASDVEDYDAHQDQKHGEHRRVPLAALQQERTRRQELQQQLAAQQQQQLAMQQQLAAFQQHIQAQQQQAQQAAEEAAIPAFNEDPEGHINALRKQFTEALQGMQHQQVAQVQAQQQVVQLRQQISHVAASVAEGEAAFAAQHPGYEQDFALVHQDVTNQLRARYPQATPQQLQEAQVIATAQFVDQCNRSGISPFEHVVARARQLRGNTAPAQHQAPRVAQPQPGIRPPTSLSNLAGAVTNEGSADFSLENVASMSDTDFDAAWQKMAGSNKPKFGF